MGGEEIPIDTFDGLLRDLLAWDLVVQGEEEDDAQTWHLVARAQQQLGVLAIGRGPWPAERTAYVGRRCADCGGRRLTWLREGSYVCDPCLQKRLACTPDESPSIASPTPKRPRWPLHLRQRIA